MDALTIKGLSKSYKKVKALRNVSLTVPQGEFFGLLGHNGAGKSTTIHCITGISTFEKGTVRVMGHDVQADYQEARAKIGLSPQEFNVDIFADIVKVLDYVGGYFGMPAEQRKTRIDELLELFDLQEHRKKNFQQLSGGMKRRFILARAMMHDPDVLILDEPTAGIDVEQRRALWKLLEELHAAGKTIILTSHYLEEVERLCSRVAIMHEGKILKELTKKEFTKGGKKLEDVYLELTGAEV